MPFLIIKSKGNDYKCLYSSKDQDLISQFTWSLHSKGYAQTNINGKSILMHRLILEIVDKPEFECDHIFHNKLDNRRAKIRICTHSENLRNSRKLKGTCTLKGVYRDNNKFHAQISSSQRVFNLGRFRSEITAAKAYDRAARKMFADFAFTNFPEYMEPKQLSLAL